MFLNYVGSDKILYIKDVPIICIFKGWLFVTDAERVIDYIEKNRSEIVRIASGLISIPSVSGRDDSNEQYNKEADYLIEEFAKFGIKAE